MWLVPVGFHHTDQRIKTIISTTLQIKVPRTIEKEKLLKTQALSSRTHLSHGYQGPSSKDEVSLSPLTLHDGPSLVLFNVLSSTFQKLSFVLMVRKATETPLSWGFLSMSQDMPTAPWTHDDEGATGSCPYG